MSPTHKKNHPYHILEPSAWPLLTSLAVLWVSISAVLYMRSSPGGGWLLLGGSVFLIACSMGWWRDVIVESLSGEHTPVVHTGFKIGMILFILSELFFFVAFFWAYFHVSLFPGEAIGNTWPPKGIVTLDPLELPYLNTLLLLLSGSTITWAHHDIVAGRIKSMIEKTGYTILLGIVFLGVQMYEYTHTAFAFKDGIYGSIFYMATGFHGFHVLVGVLFLMVCWWRAKRKHYKAHDHFGFEAAAWYWHFVDVVWLFLFVSIYLWGAS